MLVWILALVGIFVILPIVASAIRVLYEYQRGVVFTLGRFDSIRGPGLTFIIPLLQRLRVVDMRITTIDIPKQEVMTRDNVAILVNAVVYFRVVRPKDAVIEIEDYTYAVSRYTLAALRDVIGNNELDEVLTQRKKIAESIKKIVDAETAGWGIDIISVKIQEIELPAEMKRAMAAQAESERERRAVIIKSEGELAASANLLKAAQKLAKSRGSFLLRTLQTIGDIAADPSDKIVILLPVEMLGTLEKLTGRAKSE
jgi:regulator of protease activity HflC (stomatin/prohibitin superfamily)